MAAGLGFKTFTTGEVLTAADTNGYLMQGINVFANSAARAAAITSPQEGQYSYLKDTNALEYYDGAAWVGAPVGDITAVTAGKGLTGGGASGDVTVSLATSAKGDLVVGTGTTTAAALTVGNNGETLVANSAASSGLTWASPVGSLSNPTINGGMDIWQRGTSGFVPGNNSTTFAADRWNIQRGVTGATVSRQTTGDTTNLPNIQYAMRVSRDSGNTSTEAIRIGNSFESVTSIPFAGKVVTLSFYARAGANYSATSSLLNAELRTGTGTDQNTFSTYTGSATPISSDVTLTTTWQRFALTGTVAATATEMALKWVFTPTGTAGANDYYEITGVQIDVGTWTASTAPTFRRSGGTIQGELAACQRYLPAITTTAASEIGTGFNISTTQPFVIIPFQVPARVAPTGITATAANYAVRNSSGTTISLTAIAFNNASPTAAAVLGTVASGLVAGNGTSMQLNGTLLFTGCEL